MAYNRTTYDFKSEDNDKSIFIKENSWEREKEIHQEFSDYNWHMAEQKSLNEKLKKQTLLANQYSHYLISSRKKPVENP